MLNSKYQTLEYFKTFNLAWARHIGEVVHGVASSLMNMRDMVYVCLDGFNLDDSEGIHSLFHIMHHEEHIIILPETNVRLLVVTN